MADSNVQTNEIKRNGTVSLNSWDIGSMKKVLKKQIIYTLEPFSNHTHTHTHTRLTAPCPGLPGWASTRKVKPIWILLKQETVHGSGISWAICKFAPRIRHITTPAPHHSVFTGRMPFLPPNQQCQSTESTFSNQWHVNLYAYFASSTHDVINN